MKRHVKKPQKVRLDMFESRPDDSSIRQPKLSGSNRRRTVKLGKSQGKVSLMIYGNRPKARAVRHKDPLVMKRILKSKNLLRTGSAAPNSIVRALYSESTQVGDIRNRSGEIALHNFKDTA